MREALHQSYGPLRRGSGVRYRLRRCESSLPRGVGSCLVSVSHAVNVGNRLPTSLDLRLIVRPLPSLSWKLELARLSLRNTSRRDVCRCSERIEFLFATHREGCPRPTCEGYLATRADASPSIV
jgi:hypothetical protein